MVLNASHTILYWCAYIHGCRHENNWYAHFSGKCIETHMHSQQGTWLTLRSCTQIITFYEDNVKTDFSSTCSLPTKDNLETHIETITVLHFQQATCWWLHRIAHWTGHCIALPTSHISTHPHIQQTFQCSVFNGVSNFSWQSQ